MLTGRQRRLDFAVTSIEIFDRNAPAPTPERGTAVRTPEGYLEVDAYLARDGLLQYSDGRESWTEYRPREQLVLAAQTLASQPITNDHPAAMLDASNASQHIRGWVAQTVDVEDIGGRAHLRTRLKITDGALVRSIESGDTRELSIGFWATVRPERGTFDGKPFVAIQEGLEGNHVAVVRRGRSGPTCRVLLDSAGTAVHGMEIVRMRTLNLTATQLAAWTSQARKLDEAGVPTTEAKLVGPDGVEITVPTWLAAAVAELIEIKAKDKPAADPPPPEPDAPVPPPPAAAEEDDMDPDDDKDKISMDAAKALGRRRSRLERLGARCGLPEEKLDLEDDALAREIVGHLMPHAAEQAKAAKGDALDLLVDVAAAMPHPEPPRTNPWERPAPVRDAADDEREAELKILQAAGVEI